MLQQHFTGNVELNYNQQQCRYFPCSAAKQMSNKHFQHKTEQ